LTLVRRFLTPKWLAAHLVVAGVFLVMLRLGLWQWHRAQSPTGGIQNYAYAVQWPMFAVFGLVLWVRTLREELHRTGPRADRGPHSLPPDAPVIRQPGVRIGVPTPAAEIDPEDEEMLAYNARLAMLNARVAAGEARRARANAAR
jgi:hypothetical protein